MADETPAWLQGGPSAARPLDQPEICLSPTESKQRATSARRGKLAPMNLEGNMNSPPLPPLQQSGLPELGRGPLGGGAKPADPKVDSLLQSWSALDFFKANQKGALGKEDVPPQEELAASVVEEDTTFEIPILPRGKRLVLDIKSTWGMGHYVGLTGLEILDHNGLLVSLYDVKSQVVAVPSSINELPQFAGAHDPRTVDNLFNNVNKTCDDLNMWLAPFTPGGQHSVTVTFDEETTVSCIRVWNYNKSRIHASRGARYVEMFLDETKIFAGEVGQASGTTTGAEECCEILVFAEDDALLEAIDEYFISAAEAMDNGRAAAEAEEEAAQLRMSMMLERPGTSHGRPSAPATPAQPAPQPAPGDRPFTAAGRDVALDRPEERGLGPAADGGIIPSAATLGILGGKALVLQAVSGWGSPMEAGLAGVELLDGEGRPLKPWTDYAVTLELGMPALDEDSIQENPLQAIKGKVSQRSARQPISKGALDALAAALVDEQRVTTDPQHMAVLPADPASGQWAAVVFTLRPEARAAALKIWNYNDGVEGSWRGCKRMNVTYEGREVGTNVLLRKAPGTACFDFGQVIPLTPEAAKAAGAGGAGAGRPERKHMGRPIETPNPYGAAARGAGAPAAAAPQALSTIEEAIGFTTPRLPSGLIFKVLFHSSHGDPHYVGLNGIELYDESDCLIELGRHNVAAEPESINVLPSVKKKGGDARSLDKVFDGVNDTYDDRHMWLAPLRADGMPNALYCYFEKPITISHVKVWNYSKTTGRGAAECSFYLDDVLIFRGELRPAPPKGAGAAALLDLSQSILFSDDPTLALRESKRVYIPGDLRLSLIDNNVVLKPDPQGLSYVAEDLRPMTSTVGSNPSSAR